ncbi:MAG: uridine phosphorylase [Clostridiales bacterium]|nr:uridine phosphorylase [Clostridiales bacterium]
MQVNAEKLFHLGFDPTVYRAAFAILPGDPGRVEAIARRLDHPQFLTSNREYTVWTAQAAGQPVFVCSTGIGGPSTAIAVEELHMAGARTFIRIGTCGAMQLNMKGGDLVVATAAVRQEGTSLHYAPIEYPAAADFTVTAALAEAANGAGRRVHIGVVQAKDSFYGQHDPDRMPVAGELMGKWEAYKRLGVLASEMESAALFTAAAALGDRAGCVLHVIWNQEREAAGLDNPRAEDTAAAVDCAARAVSLLAEREGSRKERL